MAAYNDMLKKFNQFKNRTIPAKDIFEIREISKNDAYAFVRQFHYLGDAKFFCQQAFGLFYWPDNMLVGCATFQQPQGISVLKSWFDLPNSCTDIYELGRLCMFPPLNGTNATSFLLGGAIKQLKKAKRIRAVITLATSDRHVGSIYQVCNFTYYGLTDKKSDFYCADGRKNPRGPVRHERGVWVERPQKHRYAYILDPSLTIKLLPKQHPKKDDLVPNNCCGSSYFIEDRRFGDWYTCPVCNHDFYRIEEGDVWML